MRILRILFDFGPFLLYYIHMKRPKKQRAPKGAEQSQRGAGALANSTRGRARTFKDRRKEDARKACRGKVEL